MCHTLWPPWPSFTFVCLSASGPSEANPIVPSEQTLQSKRALQWAFRACAFDLTTAALALRIEKLCGKLWLYSQDNPLQNCPFVDLAGLGCRKGDAEEGGVIPQFCVCSPLPAFAPVCARLSASLVPFQRACVLSAFAPGLDERIFDRLDATTPRGAT